MCDPGDISEAAQPAGALELHYVCERERVSGWLEIQASHLKKRKVMWTDGLEDVAVHMKQGLNIIFLFSHALSFSLPSLDTEETLLCFLLAWIYYLNLILSAVMKITNTAFFRGGNNEYCNQ